MYHISSLGKKKKPVPAGLSSHTSWPPNTSAWHARVPWGPVWLIYFMKEPCRTQRGGDTFLGLHSGKGWRSLGPRMVAAGVAAVWLQAAGAGGDRKLRGTGCSPPTENQRGHAVLFGAATCLAPAEGGGVGKWGGGERQQHPGWGLGPWPGALVASPLVSTRNLLSRNTSCACWRGRCFIAPVGGGQGPAPPCSAGPPQMPLVPLFSPCLHLLTCKLGRFYHS